MKGKAKELAVCKAVIELMDEGADPNSMTVSQIAERAGIGKGTVYEYFSSKEDMVVSAVLYEIRQLTEELGEWTREAETFEKKFFRIFDCMAQYPEGKRSFSAFTRLINHSYEMGRPLCRELERRRDEIETQGPSQVLLELYETGVREGLVKGGLPRSVAMLTLLTKFLMYLLYLQKRSTITDVTEEEMRDILYRGILADLNLAI